MITASGWMAGKHGARGRRVTTTASSGSPDAGASGVSISTPATLPGIIRRRPPSMPAGPMAIRVRRPSGVKSYLPVPLTGDSHHLHGVTSDGPWTHVRLNIYPDGGIARLRVYGPFARDWQGVAEADLAAIENGGWLVACSDRHYGSPANILYPGTGATMAEGWETSRRRVPGNEWALFRLACPGVHLAGRGRHHPISRAITQTAAPSRQPSTKPTIPPPSPRPSTGATFSGNRDLPWTRFTSSKARWWTSGPSVTCAST